MLFKSGSSRDNITVISLGSGENTKPMSESEKITG